MSQEFPNGVSYFTDGEISLTVHFPEDKVKWSLLSVLSLRKRFKPLLVQADKQNDLQPVHTRIARWLSN